MTIPRAALHVLLFGSGGQVGRALRAVAGTDVRLESVGRDDVDLRMPADCAERILRSCPDVVINAAAYTEVDRAEREEAQAVRINADAPGEMARAAAACGATFLHLSTDYVFSGEGARPWRESDPVNPCSAYGRSKLAGERLVAAAGGDWVVLRTSWVFAAHGDNFVRTMLRAGAARRDLRVVDDQRGGPTPAEDIAVTLLTIARARRRGEGATGVYHYSGAPPTSWWTFACEIFRRADWVPPPHVAAVRSADWPTAARRPLNSVLDCTRIGDVFGIAQPDWRPALDRVVADLRPVA